MSTATDQKIILGLDIGTTSVKVCLVDYVEGKVLARQTKDTQANVPSELGCEGNKQNVPKIMSAVHICVSRLPKELMRQVRADISFVRRFRTDAVVVKLEQILQNRT